MPGSDAQVQSELATVDKTREQEQSFARVNFDPTCEAAINEQIKWVQAVTLWHHPRFTGVQPAHTVAQMAQHAA